MAQKTKQALLVENNTSFPNNTVGYITPTILREFNTDIIESLTTQIQFDSSSAEVSSSLHSLNVFTASIATPNTGSFLITGSSIGNIVTFTKADGTQFGVIVETGSLGPLNAFTSSQQILNATYVTTSSLNAFTQSQSNLNSTFATTGSNSFVGNQTVTGDVNITGTLTASLQQGYVLVGNGSNISTLIPTSSFIGIPSVGTATTGSNIFNGNQTISGSILLSGSIQNVDYIDFNTASLTPTWKSGRVFWDNTDGCLGVYNAEADITLQVGQEQWVRVRNNTGSPIVNGAVVRLVGAQGDNPLVVLAQSVQMSGSVAADNQVLGIATHTIETGTNGYITTLGNVRGLNTNAYNEGDVLWVSSSAGLLTNVVPVAPYERIPVCTVVKKGPGGSGIVYVAPIPPIDFANLSSVEISGNYANGDLWQYEGNVWKHKSIANIGLATTGSNTFTGTQTFQNISAVSASFLYVQSVTGSAVVIGNSFVVVNNDTPTAPYGGLSVYDSGSVLPTTSSLVWDGNTNDWKYSYDVGAGHDAAVMLFGPAASDLSTTTYPSNNVIQKGTGGHHIVDSTIYDSGTGVSIGVPLNVTGSISTNGNAVLTNTNLAELNTFTASQEVLNAQYATTGSNNFKGVESIGNQSGVGTGEVYLLGHSGSLVIGNANANPTYAGLTHLSASSVSTQNNIIFKTNSAVADTIISGSNNIFVNPSVPTAQFKRYIGSGNIALNSANVAQISGSMGFSPTMNNNYFGGNGSTITMRGPVSSSAWTIAGNTMLGTVNIGQSAAINAQGLVSGFTLAQNTIPGNLIVNANQSLLSSQVTISGNTLGGTTILIPSSSGMSFTNNTITDASGFTVTNQFFSSSAGIGSPNISRNISVGFGNAITIAGSLPAGTINSPSFTDNAIFGTNNILFSNSSTARVSGTFAYNNALNNSILGYQLIVTGSAFSTDTNTFGSTFVGRWGVNDGIRNKSSNTVFSVGTGTSTTRKTGFLIDSGSNIFIDGSLTTSGSISDAVNTLTITSLTASLNASLGNTFQLVLDGAVDTRLEVSNAKRGQTINLLVSQSLAGNGTLSFGSNLYESSGSFYSASQVANAKDIITLATFLETDVIYVANIKNLIL